MTIGQMLIYTNRLKEIMDSKLSKHIKAIRLANLMTDLEAAYQIPLTGKERIQAYAMAQPYVLQLYRTVSEARAF